MNRAVVLAVTLATLVAVTVLTWSGVRQEREFRRLIATGDHALAGRDTSQAIEAFSGAIALKPGSMLAYVKRGETYLRRREYTAALRDLRRSASLDPTATRPYELLGDANSALNRYERATEDYRRYVALDDRAPRVLYKLALAHFKGGHPRAAAETIRKAIAIDDRCAEAHYLLGLALRQIKRGDEARMALMHAVALNPTFALAREELADLDLAIGRRREGLEQLEALAALDTAAPDRLVRVGLAYARAGRQESALVALERAADRHPDRPQPYAAIGRVQLQVASSEEDPDALTSALLAFERAIALGDRTADTLSLYGRALILSGRFGPAGRVLAEATSTLPVDPAAFRHLAEAARRLGDHELARRAEASYIALVSH